MRAVLSMFMVLFGLNVTACAHAGNLCLPHPLRISLYEVGLYYFNGTGIDRDILDELQRRTGCAIETSAQPRTRAYARLAAGQADIVMASVINPKRDNYAVFIPYMQQRFATLVHRNVPIEKSTMAGFGADPGLRFGVVRGVNYGGAYDQWNARMLAEYRLEQSSDMAAMLRMMKAERFSGIFATPLLYEKELKDAGMLDRVRVLNWYPNEPPTARCLALSRKNFTPEQITGWRGVVQAMKSDGTLKQIIAKYLSAAEAKAATLK